MEQPTTPPTPRSLDEVGQPTPVSPMVTPAAEPFIPTSNSPKPKSKGPLYLLLGGLLVIALGGGGYYFYANQQTATPEPNVTVTPSPEATNSATVDETTNWKIYTNEQYGYEIKYPETILDEKLYIEEANGNANFTNVTKPIPVGKAPFNIGLGAEENKQKLTTESYVEKLLKEYSNVPGIKTEDVMVGTYNAKQVVGVPSMNGTIDVYFATDKLIFRFWLDPYTPESKDSKRLEWVKVFKKVLSTLKFTDASAAVDMTGWKTYKNTELKFSIKYPSNWTLSETKPRAPEAAPDLILKGKEGQLELLVMDNPGDYCQSQGTFPVNGDVLSVCSTKNSKESEHVQLSRKLVGTEAFNVEFYAYPPFENNRVLVRSILSTLELSK